MVNNPLRNIREFGQSIWQDDLSRSIILSGELKRLIEEDGLRGITSNPSIFDKSITGSRDYDDAIRTLALQGLSCEEIYQMLTVGDVRMAADLLRPVYESSDGKHGFVSLEVNPHLARDVAGTLAEARRLWHALDRPNVMIKVPGTIQGLSCIRQLISEGININVTLLFGLPRYREVVQAYLDGLEARAAVDEPLHHVASVASFFLSRIDVWVDPILKRIIDRQQPGAEMATRLYGEVAIASAKGAYRIYREIFEGKRFRALQEKGARPQRVLWASTSTKEPEFSDVKYVEALIGADTINTLPRETIDAYRDHGQPAPRLTRDMDQAADMLNSLVELDINIDQITEGLEEQGIDKFNKPYDDLLQSIETARTRALREPIDRQELALGAYDHIVKQRIATLASDRFSDRLWHKDPTLWSSDKRQYPSIQAGLGWLEVARTMDARLAELAQFRKAVQQDGLRHVVHMGMGGSSLAPLVFQRCFAADRHGLTLQVLDTTDPAAIEDVERSLPLEDTLFIVASKSGTTAEPLAFGDYFYDRLSRIRGEAAGAHFAAITDPGTPLVNLARERQFRKVFLNFKDIGGRYSALSYFGLVPAALMGLDVEDLLMRAQRMMYACAADKPVNASPGVILGAALGELARQGRDKVTFLMPPALETLGMWLEQLLAESTGKNGTGLLPVSGEPIGPPAFYGQDRVFVHITIDNEIDRRLEQCAAALRQAGQPLITIRLQDRLDVAQEFFRWEVATATAGVLLGINAFDQPNVQESKENTNRLLQTVITSGRLPVEVPNLTEAPFQIFLPSGEVESTFARTLVRFFRQIREGDYIAILAYLTETSATESLLSGICLDLQQKFRTPVTIGYGPRYLHSTGQYHKGGPDNGLYLLLTCDDGIDLDIPDTPYTFGVLRQAQARGDVEALNSHGRRVLRTHLGSNADTALAELKSILEKALTGGEW